MTPDSDSNDGQLAGRIRVTQVLKGSAPKVQYLSFLSAGAAEFTWMLVTTT